MKKVCILFLGLALMMSSCVATYDVTHQRSLYEAQMNGSKDGKVLMDKIPIYYSEEDVQKAFTVVDYCAYQPLHIPILRPAKKALKKKLYKKAVITAEKLHGDAVIIDTPNEFRVIKWSK